MFMQSSFVGEYKFTGQYYPVRVEITWRYLKVKKKGGLVMYKV